MIELFPDLALDNSIHTAILLGLVLTWLATETLGWVFAGYVVAGYLAAIAIVHPMSVVAIGLEAILTYGLVWAVGMAPTSVGLWSRVFGRERFLLFIVYSVPVRIVVEWLAGPQLKAWILPWVDLPAWQEGDFFGIGLVLVPLWANSFWKTGLARGLTQTGFVTLLTWLLLSQVVIPYSNYHLGHFAQSFDSVGLDFLSSSKLYIVLLTTAFIAAGNNLRYGWDFGGILVPSLLAISAFEPLKLLATLVEIGVLLGVYSALMKLPALGRLNLEGPRRLVSVYLTSFALKWGVALVAPSLLPTVYVTDLFGFGYLLTSLVAVKCYEKRKTAQTLMAILVTTTQGLVMGSLISLALVVLTPLSVEAQPPSEPTAGVSSPLSLERSILLSWAGVRRQSPERTGYDLPPRLRLTLQRMISQPPESLSPAVAEELRALGLTPRWVTRADGRRCLMVADRRVDSAEPRGLPSVWWCGGQGPGLLIPRPLSDGASLYHAGMLAHRSAFSLIVAEGIDDAQMEVVQLQLNRDEERRRARQLRQLFGERSVWVFTTTREEHSWLDPRTGAAPLVIGELSRELRSINVDFRQVHGSLDLWWSVLSPIDGLLGLAAGDAEALARASTLAQAPPPAERSLQEVLDEGEGRAHRRGDPPPVGSTLEERLTAVELGLPLLFSQAGRQVEGEAIPARSTHLAALLGWEVVPARDRRGEVWVVRDQATPTRAWGSWALRVGQRRPWLVLAPRAVDEPGIPTVSQHFFTSLVASALFVADAAEDLDYEHTGDLIPSAGPELPVPPLAVRRLLQEPELTPVLGGALDRGPWLLMVRRQPPATLPMEGAVLSIGHELAREEEREQLRARLGEALSPWPGVGFMDGREATAALDGGRSFPVRYLGALAPGHAINLWLSEEMLAEVDGNPDKGRRLEFYRAQGVEVVPVEKAGPLLSAIDRRRPVSLPQVTALMTTHVQTLTRAPLTRLREVSQGRVWVVDGGLRLYLVSQSAGGICLAAADPVGPGQEHPWSGCWRARG